MKPTFLAAGVLAAVIVLPLSATAGTFDAPLSIGGLQSEGWTIVKKTEEQKVLPGVAPYQDLKRVVQIVRYRLNKGTAVMICEAAYDSQRDSYRESCNKAD